MMTPIPSVAAAHLHQLLHHSSQSTSLISVVTLFTGAEMDKTYLQRDVGQPAISHGCLGFKNDCGTLITPELR